MNKKKERSLMIDDCRDSKADVIARNYFEGLRLLEKFGPWDILYLDHDLASFDKKGREKTGYDIICWLERNPAYLPGRIFLVTSNPVGRAKMQTVIDKLYGSK